MNRRLGADDLSCIWSYIYRTVQRLIKSEGAKRKTIDHVRVILQYCSEKTKALSEDIYADDSGISSLVIKWFGINSVRHNIL